MSGDDHLEGIDVVEKSAGTHTSHGGAQRKDTSDDAWDGGVHADASPSGPTPTLGTAADLPVQDDDTDVLTRGLRKKAAERKSQRPPPEPEPPTAPPAMWFGVGFAIGGLIAALAVLLLT